MKTAAWLAELYRQWRKARGGRLPASTRAFSRGWEDLLDAAGLQTAAERNHAADQVEEYEKHGYLRIRRHRYRKHLIEAIDLPVTSEPWLIALFGGSSARDLRREAVAIVTREQARSHPRWPDSWQSLCLRISAAFEEGKNLGPFVWKDPADLSRLFRILHALTAREWSAGTLIRDASTALGFESKDCEKKQGVLESALGLLFNEETSMESLGLCGSQSLATVNGPLCLHFEDGTIQDLGNLRGEFSLSLLDLQRAVLASTSATQILSIENAKTTFCQAVAANLHRDTLLLTTSFPNSATKRLLEILPPGLPHYHFGDTDPSGYAILRFLRELGCRPVVRFFMDWQDRENSPPLSEHDRRLLPALKSSPVLSDCLPFLLAMEQAGRKGCFEQEALGGPTLDRWPFWQDFL